jgi:hypothetical protein
MTHQRKEWKYKIVTEHHLFADFQKPYDSVGREEQATEFSIHMKLFRFITRL